MEQNRRALISSALALSILVTTPASAYLDPGTGSALVTTVLGFFAAIAFTARKYFYRIKALFRRGGAAPADDHEDTTGN